MKAPNIKAEIGGYVLTWSDLALTCRISRLNVNSEGEVKGFITILNSNKEHPAILLPNTTLNFSSEQTRSRYAKQLREKYPDMPVNWIEVFDYLGHQVQELARRGEPVQEVWLPDEIKPPKFLLKPFIYEGVSNIIYGEKGVNKSTLCYLMGICMALPWYDNPLGLEVPEKPVKSLVLDWETDEYIFKYYLARLKKGMNIPACPLYYRRCRLPLHEELEAIEQCLRETEAEVLIIDSMAAAAGGEQGELKGSQSALLFNSALRKLGKTSLIIAQTAKNADTNKKTIYGSVIFTYYARNIFEICRSEDDGSNSIHIGIFHRECNLGRKYPPMGFVNTFDDIKQTMRIEREPLNVGEFAEKVTTQMRIKELLKRGPLTTKEIAEGLDMKVTSIKVIIQRLKHQGKVILKDDKWGLVYS